MAEIRLEHLQKRFADFTAVRDTNLVVDDGCFFVLLGPSGCGKTTTLRMIAGLEQPSAGRILLAGEDVTGRRAAQRDIAFVFQLFALYPHMNVRRNIGFPLKSQGVTRGEIRARVMEVARLLRIEHLLDSPVSRLGSGDRQRVALGRAIVRRPKAFLMDEPLGTLDTEFRQLMCDELRQLHDRIHATTVYVTHDQVEAMSMGDRIAVMDGGVVLQTGTPGEIYDRPATRFVAAFIGSPPMNFLRIGQGAESGSEVLRINGATLPIPRLQEASSGPQVWFGVRPEHVVLGADSGLRGEVFSVEYMGARQLVTLDTVAGRIKARVPNNLSVARGEQLSIAFRTERVVVFDGLTSRALRSAANPLAGNGAGHG